jgi:hypothetical protein
VSSWADEKQNDRVHVVIAIPSGTQLIKNRDHQQ